MKGFAVPIGIFICFHGFDGLSFCARVVAFFVLIYFGRGGEGGMWFPRAPFNNKREHVSCVRPIKPLIFVELFF